LGRRTGDLCRPDSISDFTCTGRDSEIVAGSGDDDRITMRSRNLTAPSIQNEDENRKLFRKRILLLNGIIQE
jgi:hypothetical protein